MKALFYLTFVVSISLSAWAQIDASSSIILRSSKKGSSSEDFDSSRYTIKHAPTKPPPPVPLQQPIEKKREKYKPEPTEQVQVKSEVVTPAAATTLPDASTTDTISPVNQAEQMKAPEPVAPPVESPREVKNIGDQVKETVLGGNDEAIQQYRQMLHPEDPRRNLVELDLAPTLMYMDASSNYWYRRFFLFAPGLNFGARVWVTPFFGIYGNFLVSTTSEISGNPANTKNSPVDQDWFEIGMMFKKHVSMSRTSSSFVVGVGYNQYQMRVPADDNFRIRLNTTGMKAFLTATMPSTSTFAWQIGGELSPRANHTESATGVTVKTGSSNTTNGMGIWFGGRHFFGRANQIYWRFGQTVEKVHYDGTATPADPVTGATLENVSVTNSTSQFQFGFTWGQ